jgi:hypothetical protein
VGLVVSLFLAGVGLTRSVGDNGGGKYPQDTGVARGL